MPTTPAPSSAPTWSPTRVPTPQPSLAPTGFHCTNGVQDADESDVDCGGSECPRCDTGLQCSSNADCRSRICGAPGLADDDTFCSSGESLEPCVCITTPAPSALPSPAPSPAPSGSPSLAPSPAPTPVPSFSPPVITRLFVRGANTSEVSPTVRLVVEAEYTSSDPATTLLWSAAGAGDPDFALEPGVTTSTRLNLATVVVRANSLEAGESYVFTMTATNSLGNFDLGTLNVTAGRPPFNGTLAVSPDNGTALTTTFALTTADWEDDPSSYPLAYVFLYTLEDGDLTLLEAASDGSERFLNGSGAASLRTSLALGDEDDDYRMTLAVEVTDVIGSSASLSRQVFVLPPAVTDAVDTVESGLGAIEDTIRARNWVSAAVLIEASASVLNYAFREGANTTAAAKVRRDLLTRTEALVRDSDRNTATVESQVRAGGG